MLYFKEFEAVNSDPYSALNMSLVLEGITINQKFNEKKLRWGLCQNIKGYKLKRKLQSHATDV